MSSTCTVPHCIPAKVQLVDSTFEGGVLSAAIRTLPVTDTLQADALVALSTDLIQSIERHLCSEAPPCQSGVVKMMQAQGIVQDTANQAQVAGT